MSTPAPDERPALHLLGALGAVRRTQSLLLVDLEQTCRGDAAFLSAFRRWQELLCALRLHHLRLAQRVLHLATATHLRREFSAPRFDRESANRRWVQRFSGWFALIKLDPLYRHLDSILDADGEPVTADIITDFAMLAETMEAAMPALAALDDGLDDEVVEDLAFFQVAAPWRRRALSAALDSERWLAEQLAERDDA
jgi:hypothetical protein